MLNNSYIKKIKNRTNYKTALLSFLILYYYLRICKTESQFNLKNKIKEQNNSNENYLDKHIKILRDSAVECTLFLNKNDEFPINNPCSILLLGRGARFTLKGGRNLGSVNSKFTTCEEGLEKAGFTITTKEWLNGDQYSFLKDSEEPRSDIAVYILSRSSGQGRDRKTINGDILLSKKEIKDILYLNKKYKKFMLVLNVCGVVDLSPIKEVSNILLLSQLGDVTGDILSDIILGKKNPSGKLATTWASLDEYKYINEVGKDDTNYIEGLYVGYRYFNSVGIKPLYPFGFGMSFTSFDISKIAVTNLKDEINIKVNVKNIGKFSGKEVVQVYISPSQENENKPYQSLVAFKKTPEIKPLEEIQIDLVFELKTIARYDENKSCYILDKGKYIIRVGNSSEKTNIYAYIELDDDIITQQLQKINVYNLGFEELSIKINLKDNLSSIQKIKLSKDDFNYKKIEYNYECQINNKIKNLKEEDLAKLCIGDYEDINEKKAGIIGLTTKSIKKIKMYIRMADGPTGIKLVKFFRDNNNHDDKSPVSIPIETALAQSFNTELMEEYGNIIREEMEIFNIQLWLAPALNIHRNILCGRNFEYFSEDPFLTGKMAAAIIRSVQSEKNKGATIKHFVANNQETNKYNSNSKISERTLREIYLKGFQIAIEESHPLALMTSYNLVNGLHPSENKELLIDIVRNEWNFKGLIMSDWTISGLHDSETSKYMSQNVFNNIKGGNNLMMPGSEIDYNILIEKYNEKLLSKNDLLNSASKVYETLELLNK